VLPFPVIYFSSLIKGKLTAPVVALLLQTNELEIRSKLGYVPLRFNTLPPFDNDFMFPQN
jgi:hypothetical protein